MNTDPDNARDIKVADEVMAQIVKDTEVIQAMQRYGGSFVKALAEAALQADGINLLRIKEGWPEYWRKYTEVALISRRTDKE